MLCIGWRALRVACCLPPVVCYGLFVMCCALFLCYWMLLVAVGRVVRVLRCVSCGACCLLRCSLFAVRCFALCGLLLVVCCWLSVVGCVLMVGCSVLRFVRFVAGSALSINSSNLCIV